MSTNNMITKVETYPAFPQRLIGEIDQILESAKPITPTSITDFVSKENLRLCMEVIEQINKQFYQQCHRTRHIAQIKIILLDEPFVIIEVDDYYHAPLISLPDVFTTITNVGDAINHENITTCILSCYLEKTKEYE